MNAFLRLARRAVRGCSWCGNTGTSAANGGPCEVCHGNPHGR